MKAKVAYHDHDGFQERCHAFAYISDVLQIFVDFLGLEKAQIHIKVDEHERTRKIVDACEQLLLPGQKG